MKQSFAVVCSCVGAVAALSCCALIVTSLLEHMRFVPFFRDVLCIDAPLTIPIKGFESLLDAPSLPTRSTLHQITTSSCKNPNQISFATKKDDFARTIYVPNDANSQWRTQENTSSSEGASSYSRLASAYLGHDYFLPAEAGATSSIGTIIDTSSPILLELYQRLLLIGYVPLYTKTLTNIEYCINLFGSSFCGAKREVVWCGALAGRCQIQVGVGSAKVWIPGLCEYTSKVCRSGDAKGEVAMKALVTASHFNVSVMDMPCSAESGLLPNMTCPTVSAPGINATLHQVGITTYVDGPYPEEQDIRTGKAFVLLLTGVVAGASVFGLFCVCGLSRLVLRQWSNPPATMSHSATSSPYPTILTSKSATKKKVHFSDDCRNESMA